MLRGDDLKGPALRGAVVREAAPVEGEDPMDGQPAGQGHQGRIGVVHGQVGVLPDEMDTRLVNQQVRREYGDVMADQKLEYQGAVGMALRHEVRGFDDRRLDRDTATPE